MHTWQGGVLRAWAVLGSGKGRPLTGTITPKRCTTGIVLPAAGGHLCILLPLQRSASRDTCLLGRCSLHVQAVNTTNSVPYMQSLRHAGPLTSSKPHAVLLAAMRRHTRPRLLPCMAL